MNTGYLETQSTGNDPILLSPSGLGISADSQNRIEFRMKASAGTLINIFYKSASDPSFSSLKCYTLPIGSHSSFVTYQVDMTGVPGWEGEIDRIRLDPTNSSGATIQLDFFRVCMPTVVRGPAWEFNGFGDLEGWLTNGDLGLVSVSGGFLSGISTGVDPILRSPADLEVKASVQPIIEMRMKVSAGSRFQVFFKRSTDPGFSGLRSKMVTIPTNSEFVKYCLDMSTVGTYTGTVTQFRIDPTTANGATVDIDYVRVGMPTHVVDPLWEFETNDDTQGWSSLGHLSALQVLNGYLSTTSTGDDPRLRSPAVTVDTRFAKFFLAAMEADVGNFFDVFFKPVGGTFTSTLRKRVPLSTNVDRALYAVDLRSIANYEANSVDRLRFDPVEQTGSSISIDSLGMVRQEMAVGERAEFNQQNNLEGWSVARHLSAPVVRYGTLRTTSTGTDSQILSPPDLMVNASNDKNVVIRMKTDKGTLADLFYKRETDIAFSATRRKRVPITSNSDFVTYNLDMSGDPNWSGVVQRLRLDPTTLSGANIELDYIRTYGPVQTGAPEWRWGHDGNTQGWTDQKDISSLAVSEGMLKATTNGTDPILLSPISPGIDAGTQKFVVIRMKVSAGAFAELYYRQLGQAFSNTRKKRFNIRNNAEFVTYQLDMSGDPNWTGTIERLRLDPTSISGATIEIDHILVP